MPSRREGITQLELGAGCNSAERRRTVRRRANKRGGKGRLNKGEDVDVEMQVQVQDEEEKARFVGSAGR